MVDQSGPVFFRNFKKSWNLATQIQIVDGGPRKNGSFCLQSISRPFLVFHIQGIARALADWVESSFQAKL